MFRLTTVLLPERGREVVGYRQKGSKNERERERERKNVEKREADFSRGEESLSEIQPGRWPGSSVAMKGTLKRNRAADHAANFYGHTLFGSQATYNFRNPVRELPPPKSERARDFNMYPLSRLKLAPEFLKRAFHRPLPTKGGKNFRGAHLRPPFHHLTEAWIFLPRVFIRDYKDILE